MSNYKAKLKDINTFIFDYDGVLSDGKIWVINPDTQIRSANAKDGYALHHAVKQGYNVAVISGGRGQTIKDRMGFLGIHDVFLEVHYKKAKFLEYMAEKGIDAQNVLYMGDDIPDFELMKMAGVSACPFDAAKEIQEVADYISHIKGGEGCARDVIEQVMRLHGKWFNEESLHW